MKQCSFYNTNVLLKTISMSCARARSCQTSHAINAAVSTANSPSHGRWELDRALKAVLPLPSLPACSPTPLLGPAARWGHLKGRFCTSGSQPPQILSSKMFPCTSTSYPAVMFSPPLQPRSSFRGASPCEPEGHKPYTCVFLASVNSHHPEDRGKSLRRDMTSARLCFAEAPVCLHCP